MAMLPYCQSLCFEDVYQAQAKASPIDDLNRSTNYQTEYLTEKHSSCSIPLQIFSGG